MDEEDSKALKRMNESQEDKAAKKQKLDEDVEELKRHLQLVPNDKDDVYTEATPLALKIEADDQATQTILLGLPKDIYTAVDSCETAQEIWLRV
nr:ribonuclease H-like domain-containing protein [Tanacetum cinerariifolium]